MLNRLEKHFILVAVPSYFTSFFKIVLCKHCQSGKDAAETKSHKNSSRAVKNIKLLYTGVFLYKAVWYARLMSCTGEKRISFSGVVLKNTRKLNSYVSYWTYFKYLLPDRIFLLTGFHLQSPLQSKGSTSFQSKRKEHNAEAVICYG